MEKQQTEATKNFIEQNTEAFREEPAGFDLVKLTNTSEIKEIPTQPKEAINRCSLPALGGVSAAIKKERTELIELLKKWVSSVKGSEVGNKLDWLCFVPNAKLPYVNKMIKTAIRTNNGKISSCDKNWLSYMWINSEAKEQMMSFVDEFLTVDPAMTTFTIENPKSKAGYTFSCMKDPSTKQYTAGLLARNPGFVPFQSGYVENECQCDNKYEEGKCAGERLHTQDYAIGVEAACKLFSAGTEGEGYETLEPGFAKWLMMLRDTLTKNSCSLKHVKNLLDQYYSIRKMTRNVYLHSLLSPWENLSPRIPVDIPIPSSTIQVKHNVSITTNSSGRAAWVFAPTFLTIQGLTSFGVNNDVTLDGSSPSDFFLGVDVGQNLPARIYSNYRLVSMGLKTTYIGDNFNAAGYTTQSVSYNGSAATNSIGAAINSYAQYGQTKLIEDGYFLKTSANKPGATNTSIYLPTGILYKEYSKINEASNTPFLITGYIEGAPASTRVLRIDVVMNYELLVENSFSDYIPTSVYTGSDEDFVSASEVIKNAIVEQKVPSLPEAEMNNMVNKRAYDNIKYSQQLEGMTEEQAAKVAKEKLQDIKFSLPNKSGHNASVISDMKDKLIKGGIEAAKTIISHTPVIGDMFGLISGVKPANFPFLLK